MFFEKYHRFLEIVCILVICGCSAATSADPSRSYDILYTKAVEAYLDENWEQCVTSMNEALEDYHFYIDAQVGCRLSCQKPSSNKYITPQNLEDLTHWETMIKQTLCILKCKKKVLKGRAEIISRSVSHDFESFKPYDYLQLCYFKINDLLKAASCAYTFLTINPNHDVMKDNLRFYVDELKVDTNYIINLEAKAYVDFYVRGSDAYKKEDHARAANYMEMSLAEYLLSDAECRVHCEGPFDQGWFPDFISSISNHYTFTLKCKQLCVEKLGNLNGEVHADLFPSHYNYLQFIYYKLGDLFKACQAVASYQLFSPEDEIMAANKEFYLTLPAVEESMFGPRPEALQYFERQKGEKDLVKFIEENFQFDEGDLSEPNMEEQHHESNEVTM